MKIKYLVRGIGIGIFAAGLIGFIVGMTGGLVTDRQAIEKAEKLGYMTEEEFREKFMTSEPVKLTDQTPGNADETSEKKISEEILPSGMKTSEETETSENVSEEVKSEETKESTEDTKKAEEEEKKKAEEEAKKKAEEEEKKKAEEEAKKKAEEEEKKKAEEEAKKKAEEEEKKKAEEEAKKKAEEDKKKAENAEKRDSEADGTKVTITISSGQYSESVSAACEQAGLVKSATEFNKFLCDNGYSGKLRVGSHEIAKGASYLEIAKALCGG